MPTTVPQTVTALSEGRVNGFWRRFGVAIGEAIVAEGTQETKLRATAVARATTTEVLDCRMNNGGGGAKRVLKVVVGREGKAKARTRTRAKKKSLVFLCVWADALKA